MDYHKTMPDKRLHRGPHPEDAKLFIPESLPLLRRAVADLSWLQSRGYADKSSLKLVGDHYNLSLRQRIAVMRSACSDAQLRQRSTSQLPPENISGGPLILDGYNLLITTEAALGGGILLMGRDGCIRDLASIHGTYRKVEETLPAIEVIAQTLSRLHASGVMWLLDKPVSNSGRLKKILLEYAQTHTLNWDVQLVPNPDKQLIASDAPIVTSDSAVLDACRQWLNLAPLVIGHLTPTSLVDLKY
jgi:hypothetical protein